MPKVVALLPAWNAEAFLEPVLESLAAQTHPHFEVLISDDASRDGTVALCERFSRAHPNFRLIRQPRNLGWVGNVNALLREARGDFLFFAFHDDLVRPTYVARLAAALDARPGAVLAFSDMVRVERDRDGTLRELGVEAYTDLEGVTERLQRGLIAARGQGRSYVITLANRGLFRSDAARRVGGLRRHPGGEFGADWPWLLHLALLGEFVRVPEPLVVKTYSPRTLSATWRRTARQRSGVLYSCAREILRSPLAPAEKLRIGAELLHAGARRAWWRMSAAGVVADRAGRRT